MAEYGCRIFRPSASFAEARLAVAAAGSFCAETDDIAWIEAEALLLQRNGCADRFEFRQSDRRACRHLAWRIDRHGAQLQPFVANDR